MIRGPRPQRPFDGSAGIIAVFHALPRLLAPRHPPHALSSLAALAPPSRAAPWGAGQEDLRSRFQVTAPLREWGVTILLSSGICRDRHETRAAAGRGRRRPVAIVMQLLPPPVCQRASPAQRDRFVLPCSFVQLHVKDSCVLHHPFCLTRCSAG